jgi:hypothetical protein
VPFLDVKSEFYRVAVGWLRQQTGNENIAEITYWDDDRYDTGGCPTCAYTEYTVDITYKEKGFDRYSPSKGYTYTGRFNDMLESIFAFAESQSSGT